MSSGENNAVITKPDWTIEELYRKAWQIVKNNKMLWVFGAAIGAGLSFNNNLNFNSKDIKDFQKIFEGSPAKTGNELARVLGAATSKTGEQFSQLFSAIPVYFWLLLGLEFLFLLLFALAISFIFQAWATGALLENIDRCTKGGKAVIREASEKAFTVIKPLLWLNIIPGFILALGGIAGFAAFGVIIAFAPSALKFMFGFLLFLFVIFLIYAWIMLTASLIWATRKVVTENSPAKEALRVGYKISKKKFWAMLLLALVNNSLVVIIFGAPLAIVIGLIIGAVFVGVLALQPLILTVTVFLGALLLFALIIAGAIVSGILGAFKAAVWSLAYNNIKGKYETR